MTTRFEPPITETSTPYWDATRSQALVLPYCTTCDRPHWYPREVCPWCLTETIEWRPASGRGTVYAVSVMHKPGPMRDAADGIYAVALVDLDEGVRIMTNVPVDVSVGDAVSVQWSPLSDGRHLPEFAPI